MSWYINITPDLLFHVILLCQTGGISSAVAGSRIVVLV